MKKRYRVAVIVGIIILTAVLFMNIQKKNEYEAYLKQENENSISSILSNIHSIDEILKDYEETDEITYAELSRIGSLSLDAEYELMDLHQQLSYYVSANKYSNENFNAVRSYFDGISLFITMDVLQGIGNYYPHMYNDETYQLNEDEILILGHMFDLNQKFIEVISNEDLINDKINSKEYSINLDNNNGLGDLIDLTNLMVNVSKDYLSEIETNENSKLVEDFILRVSYLD